MKFEIYVDYGRTVEAGLAAGSYRWKSRLITEDNFPHTERGTKSFSLELVHFGSAQTTESVLAELRRSDLRPANLQELLAIGEQFPEAHEPFFIVALGSTWVHGSGKCYVPCLEWQVPKRRIFLRTVVADWCATSYFAAIA